MSGQFVKSPYGNRPIPPSHPYYQQDALAPSPHPHQEDHIYRTRPSRSMDTPRYEEDSMPPPYHNKYGRSSRVGPHPDYEPDALYYEQEPQCCLCALLSGNRAQEPRYPSDRPSRYDRQGPVMESPGRQGMRSLQAPERPTRHSVLAPPHPEYDVPRRSKSEVVPPYGYHGPPREYRDVPPYPRPVGYDDGIPDRNVVRQVTEYQPPMGHVGPIQRNPNAPAPGEWRA